jgi:hypothetical protein
MGGTEGDIYIPTASCNRGYRYALTLPPVIFQLRKFHQTISLALRYKTNNSDGGIYKRDGRQLLLPPPLDPGFRQCDFQFISLHPEAMLSAPRRYTALPNSDGALALYTTYTYNFTTHSPKYGLWVMNLPTGKSTLFSNSSAVEEAHWPSDGNEIIWLVSEDNGSTGFWVGNVTEPDAE